MKFIILIVMFMFDPLHVGDDSVVMLSQHDKPLVFNNVEKCTEYVNGNLKNLIEYANLMYKNEGIVKEILCVKDLKRSNAV
ncbi:hypothetical protein [uncultured virus]|uniref:Uncharacterized protein n=1 Tax=uncultured virus TaxID=340016 RepID=A0A218MN29_9VIRU|nr:hypothetical protein [uncultured virus]